MKPVPESCSTALAAIEANPLELPEEVREHLRHCPTCAEVRVLWLAQEPFSPAIPPAGYFESLPSRILQKLPPAPHRRHAFIGRHALWAAAAILAVAAGIGGFMAGRMNRTPVLEASMVKPPAETIEAAPDTPFRDGDEDLKQLMNLTPEETRVLLNHLKSASQDK